MVLSDVTYINTLRDFARVTTFLASTAMVFASLIATLSFQQLDQCKNMRLVDCDPHVVYVLGQLLALVVHFFLVFVSMIQATRLITHTR